MDTTFDPTLDNMPLERDKLERYFKKMGISFTILLEMCLI